MESPEYHLQEDHQLQEVVSFVDRMLPKVKLASCGNKEAKVELGKGTLPST